MVLAAGVAVMAYFDGRAVHASRSWCTDSDARDCDYLTFWGLVFTELALACMWLAEAVLLVLYARKFMGADFDDLVAFNWDEDHHGYVTDEPNPHAAARRAL